MKGCGGHIGDLPCCTVIHGDCEEYLQQIQAGSVDLVVTDPPYGMNYRSKKKNNGHRRIRGDDKPYPAKRIRQLIKIPRLGSYFFCRWNNLWDHDELLPQPASVIVWVKPNGGSAGDCLYSHSRWYEMALFYPNRKQERIFLGRPPDVVFSPRTKTELHLTPKPIWLMEQMLKWYNFKTVLDPYMGRGSTCRAAKQLGKHFLGFEIDREIYETAVRFIDRPVPKNKTAILPTDDQQPRLIPGWKGLDY